MAWGNFFKGIVAQVNPFDKGKTFGSYNPSRKRREDEERQANISRQTAPTPQTSTPRNIFDQPKNNFGTDALRNIGIIQPNNNVTVPRKSEYESEIPKPKQSF